MLMKTQPSLTTSRKFVRNSAALHICVLKRNSLNLKPEEFLLAS